MIFHTKNLQNCFVTLLKAPFSSSVQNFKCVANIILILHLEQLGAELRRSYQALSTLVSCVMCHDLSVNCNTYYYYLISWGLIHFALICLCMTFVKICTSSPAKNVQQLGYEIVQTRVEAQNKLYKAYKYALSKHIPPASKILFNVNATIWFLICQYQYCYACFDRCPSEYFPQRA